MDLKTYFFEYLMDLYAVGCKSSKIKSIFKSFVVFILIMGAINYKYF
ncbi:hypothetical protein BGAPBR_K0008 (plasmid) [Borreliella garinii PBr]|uniref:Uncharacterized protein n=1 Tax=Borreliella garinii PBr TaxID=498743 RepID=B8F0P1_BORGR|nr:hypothetical protein BGAPBR_K0008 [Borreliella garinii PBr]